MKRWQLARESLAKSGAPATMQTSPIVLFQLELFSHRITAWVAPLFVNRQAPRLAV